MLRARRLLIAATVTAVLAVVLTVVGVALHVSPPGFERVSAVVRDLRVVQAPTSSWRPYARGERYEAELVWEPPGGGSREAWAEVGLFEHGHLQRGQRVQSLVKPGPPLEVRVESQTNYEVFLVVLGVLSLVATLALFGLGLRLEARVRGGPEDP